jgi:hypothetical protein
VCLQRATVTPVVRKAHRRQLGRPDRLLDVLVAEVGLQRAGVVALVRQRKAAGVPEHVWMCFEPKLGRDALYGRWHFPPYFHYQ